MPDSDPYRCPNCDSTDLVSIQLTAIDDELLECSSYQRLCKVKYGLDGALRLAQV
jgi:hypothetical protein